jgi:hypothetical protein
MERDALLERQGAGVAPVDVLPAPPENQNVLVAGQYPSDGIQEQKPI